MKGAVILERAIALREFPDPEPGPGEALVRLKATTLCGSDLGLYHSTEQERRTGRDTWGFIGGHEACGVVERLGEGAKGLRVGDRVVVYHIQGCGYCRYCTSGWMLHCENKEKVSYGYNANGGLAPYMVAKDVNCVKLPEGLTFIDGACCACGTGTAYQSLRRLGVSGRDHLAVFGLGPVGLSAVMLGNALGATVIGIDLVPERLALAQSLGATAVIDASQEDPVAKLREVTEGRGTEALADYTGSSQARRQMVDAAAVSGRVAFVGHGRANDFILPEHVISKQLTIVCSWVYGLWQLHELLDLLVDHTLHPEEMVTHRFSLDEIGDAFRLFDSRRCGKIAIVWP